MAAETTLSGFTQVGEAIGTVSKAVGVVAVVRADGTHAELGIGDPVYQGDTLETGPDGAVGIVLADETTFSMAENGNIVLDEMVYDPSAQEGAISLSVVKGVFTFVSGQVAKTDPEAMTLHTPMATIGIRGTQAGVDLADGENLTVVLMKEADDFVGEVVIFNAYGEMILNQALQAVSVGGVGAPPSAIFMLSIDDITGMFGTSLYYLPLDGNVSGNDYGLQAGPAPSGDDADIAELAGFDTAAGGEPGQPGIGVGSIPTVGGDYTAPQAGPEAIPLTSPVTGGGTPPSTTGGGGTATTPTAAAAVANTAPTASDDVATTDENSSIAIDVLANDSDPDAGDVLSLQGAAISNDGLGVVSIADNQIVYDPGDAYDYLSAGEQATVDITYTVADAAGATDTAIATVTVTGTNDLPQLEVNLGVDVASGDTVVIGNEILSVTDIDVGDQITYRLVDGPDYGLLKLGGSALGVDDTFTQQDIDTGLLTYLNESGGNGGGSHDWGGD
ncbi:MAG: Ig-like domain-containing protein, partial [Rhodospirillales bacterium]|nr:Ig-like domain-containing protein [Rhodospirillales bacterium]